MMLPQFGFIVAQAGADSHSLPVPSTPVPPPPSVSNAGASSLAPLLHSKPFNFGHGGNSSSNMSSNEVGYYHNKYNNSNTGVSSLPYYTRQPSPPPSQLVIQQPTTLLPPPPPLPLQQQKQQVVTPPPQTFYNSNAVVKEIIPKGFMPVNDNMKKRKDATPTTSPWYRHQPPITPYYNNNSSSSVEVIEESEDHTTNNKWHETTSSSSAVTRHEVKEFNDLMTWMDNEFWEQADEIYQEKLSNLQNELVSLQKGTHSAFREMIADYELKREKTIKDAECFMKYEISFIEQCFDQDISALEEEYEIERRNLQDTLITSIEDKRRQIKDDTDENNDNEDAGNHNNNNNNSNSVRSKRNLRKRNADSTALKTEPLSKRRAVRPSTLHNIHTISPIEEDELEAEYLNMKKVSSK